MVLADTGYWLALANARDRWHEKAVAVGRQLTEPLVVTWPVVTETCHLMLSRLGVRAETRFIEQIARNVELHELERAHLVCRFQNDVRSSGASFVARPGHRRSCGAAHPQVAHAEATTDERAICHVNSESNH